MPPKKRGRPLFLGDLDSPVQDYIRMLHLSGGVVNARLVVAAARGLIIARNRSLIADYGGHLATTGQMRAPLFATLRKC